MVENVSCRYSHTPLNKTPPKKTFTHIHCISLLAVYSSMLNICMCAFYLCIKHILFYRMAHLLQPETAILHFCTKKRKTFQFAMMSIAFLFLFFFEFSFGIQNWMLLLLNGSELTRLLYFHTHSYALYSCRD